MILINGLNEIQDCEVCGNKNLENVLDLGFHPLCDDLVAIDNKRQCKEYPVQILFCNNCQTAHQRFQVPKTELFPTSYHYRARFTLDVLKGMDELVGSLINKYGDLNGKKVLDIGCNDGSLLDVFSSKGAITYGIEPTDAFNEALEKGHNGFKDFFSSISAKRFLDSFGKIDIITFTNVFAHIEDLNEVLTALKIVMKEESILIIENHYLGAVLEKNQFDTFYHEHPRTYSATSFKYIANKLDRQLLNIEFPKRYGGNIRVVIGKRNITNFQFGDDNFSQLEFDFVNQFTLMRSFIENWRTSTRLKIIEYVSLYGRIKGKSLPGRASIIIKLLGLSEEEIEAIYEKPGSKKIGNYVPGTRIPILSDDELVKNLIHEKVLINFAWHIHSEIESYLKNLGFNGTLIRII
jgi:hypothetical protein